MEHSGHYTMSWEVNMTCLLDVIAIVAAFFIFWHWKKLSQNIVSDEDYESDDFIDF